jgi:hypothetical protein
MGRRKEPGTWIYFDLLACGRILSRYGLTIETRNDGVESNFSPSERCTGICVILVPQVLHKSNFGPILV